MKKVGEEMIEVATNIVKGNGFSAKFIFDKDTKPTAIMAPIYPYSLSLLLRFFGMNGYLIIQLIQAIVSSLICVILYLTGLRVFNNERVALIASFLSIFYLPLIYYCTVIWSGIFFVFLVTLYIYNLLKSESEPGWYRIILSGLILGIALITDPVMVSFIPLSSIWVLLNLKTDFKTSLKRVILMVSLSLLIVLPWTIRNYMVFDRFVFVKSHLGFNFWLGNNPYATGTEKLTNKDSSDYKLPDEEYDYLMNLNESERDRLFLSKALTFIKENPEKVIRLFLKKFKSFWWIIENKKAGFTDDNKVKAMKITYGIPFLLALLGMLLSYNRIKYCSLIWFFLLSLSFIYSLTIVAVYRYRLPVEPYLLLFAAVTISKIADRFLIRNKV